jgi:ABC-type uncharacterized transport system substrate-binding protein
MTKYGLAYKGLHHNTVTLFDETATELKKSGLKLFPITQESGVDRSTIGDRCPQLKGLKA